MNALRERAKRMMEIDLELSESTDAFVDQVEPLAYLGGMAHGMGLTLEHAICAAEAAGLKLRAWSIRQWDGSREHLRPKSWVAEMDALIAKDEERRAALLLQIQADQEPA